MRFQAKQAVHQRGEKKEFLLEEHHPIWVESVFYINYMNSLFNRQASERLHGKMTGFVSKKKGAQIPNGSRLILEV
ncbi:hypothetical protein AB3S75_019627 [Citrus x aurantiifolia]